MLGGSDKRRAHACHWLTSLQHVLRFQELNKLMYKNDMEWMQRFEKLLGQAKRYVRFCASIYEPKGHTGDTFFTNTLG